MDPVTILGRLAARTGIVCLGHGGSDRNIWITPYRPPKCLSAGHQQGNRRTLLHYVQEEQKKCQRSRSRGVERAEVRKLRQWSKRSDWSEWVVLPRKSDSHQSHPMGNDEIYVMTLRMASAVHVLLLVPLFASWFCQVLSGNWAAAVDCCQP